MTDHLHLPRGYRLVRWTTLTPVNCGDTAGSAAVDRPVALDAWHRLPYLPSSSLKGVLAGRFGNAPGRGGAGASRKRLFGAPDDDEVGGGKPSDLVFGDGEPLAFPIVLADGRRARVVVATTLYSLAALGLIEAPSLRRVAAEDAYSTLPEPLGLPPVPMPLRPARFGVDGPLLTRLVGTGGPFVVAAPRAAEELWRASSETRTLTALGPDRRVQSGSLRTIELIPPESVFVSLVDNLAGEEADLGPAAPIQLGAWENVGFGYVRAELVGEEPTESENGTDDAVTEPTPADMVGRSMIPPQEVMLRIFEATQSLVGRPESSRVRSAIFDLGPRLRIRGMPATLAFCLAKAGGGDEATEEASELSVERRAYRWLLRQLFAVPARSSHANLADSVMRAIAGEAPLPPDFEPTRLWLRRYAEVLLPPENEHD